MWPDRDSIQKTMPFCFQPHYGLRVTSIIDCFQLFIEKPSDLLAKSCTRLQYKPAKYLISITNAPATFQRLMECTLAGLTMTQCLIYLDDIVVLSKSFPDHLKRLDAGLQRLRNSGLKLKASKCHFSPKEVRYLGCLCCWSQTRSI